MAMTYASLTQQVLSYINNTAAQTQAQVPNFIGQAEQRICRECKTIGLEQYVISQFTVGQPVYAKPGRWRRTISFSYNNIDLVPAQRTSIDVRVYEYLRDYWPDSTAVGMPLFYADYGFYNLLVAPTPQTAYDFELCYLELPDPLTDANQTNWLTNYAPDALLYATLLETAPYLKNDGRVPTWTQYYDRALASLTAEDKDRVMDRGANRDAD